MSKEQRFTRAEFLKRHYPSYEPISSDYEELILSNLHRGMTVLDGGCGKSNGIPRKYLQDDSIAIALDVEAEALRHNTDYDSLCLGDLERLPFKYDTFDLIVTHQVIEHLRNPNAVFAEFARTLKKGGVLVIVTPNLYDPLIFGAKFTPQWLHRIFFKLMSGRDERGPHPASLNVYYRCNTIRSLDKQLNRKGFERQETRMKGDWTLFCGSRFTFLFWIIIDKITNYGFLKVTKTNICASYKKVF
jgi:SAM-dependent methyltransferase